MCKTASRRSKQACTALHCTALDRPLHSVRLDVVFAVVSGVLDEDGLWSDVKTSIHGRAQSRAEGR